MNTGQCYIRRAADKDGNLIDGVYYVGATYNLSKRYRRRDIERYQLQVLEPGNIRTSRILLCSGLRMAHK
jgi:hypothetical protein